MGNRGCIRAADVDNPSAEPAAASRQVVALKVFLFPARAPSMLEAAPLLKT